MDYQIVDSFDSIVNPDKFHVITLYRPCEDTNNNYFAFVYEMEDRLPYIMFDSSLSCLRMRITFWMVKICRSELDGEDIIESYI